MADITSHFAFPAFALAGAEQSDRGAVPPFVRPGQPAGAIGPASDFTAIFAQLLSGGSAASTQPSRVGEPDSQSPAAVGAASEIDIAALLDDLPPDLQQVIGDMLARNGGDWIVGFAQALAQHHQGVAAGGPSAPASFDTPAGGCATPVRPLAVIAGSKETPGMALPPAPSSHEDDVAPRPNPAAIPGLQDALPKPLVDNDAGTGPAPGISPRPATGPGLAPKPQPDSDATPLTAGPGPEVAPRPAPHPPSMPTDHDTLPKGHAPGVTPRPVAPAETASSDTDTPTKPRTGDPVTDVSPQPAAAPVAASTDPVAQPKPREDDAGLGAGASPRPGPAPQTGSSDTDTPAKPRNGDPIAGVSPRPAATPVAASAAPISEPKSRGDDAAGPAPAVTPRPAAPLQTASSDTDTAPNPRSGDAAAGASPWPGIGPAATPGPDSPAKPRASDAPAPGIAPRPNPMATTAAATLDMAPKTPSGLGATPRPAPASSSVRPRLFSCCRHGVGRPRSTTRPS
ncbi:MAG: hypothetical protein R3D85_09625 [Paracoccaceae bacterium]